MLFLIAFVGAAIIAFVLWKAMSAMPRDDSGEPGRQAPGPSRPRVSGPDDDPDFLRQLDERVRRQDDPPS
jgi:hypothetical protein